jgi:hypothetical protein
LSFVTASRFGVFSAAILLHSPTEFLKLQQDSDYVLMVNGNQGQQQRASIGFASGVPLKTACGAFRGKQGFQTFRRLVLSLSIAFSALRSLGV